MIVKQLQIMASYDSQKEFVEHLLKMIKDGYLLSSFAYQNKDKNNCNAFYVKSEEVENGWARKKARYNKRRYMKMRRDLHSAMMDIMEVRNRYWDSNIQFGIDSALNILRGYFGDD